jgi:hypothetical protein
LRYWYCLSLLRLRVAEGEEEIRASLASRRVASPKAKKAKKANSHSSLRRRRISLRERREEKRREEKRREEKRRAALLAEGELCAEGASTPLLFSRTSVRLRRRTARAESRSPSVTFLIFFQKLS